MLWAWRRERMGLSAAHSPDARPLQAYCNAPPLPPHTHLALGVGKCKVESGQDDARRNAALQPKLQDGGKGRQQEPILCVGWGCGWGGWVLLSA